MAYRTMASSITDDAMPIEKTIKWFLRLMRGTP